MKNPLNTNDKNYPSVPGIGVAGVVMCPYFRGACLKSGCELWVELRQGENVVGRCTLSWQAILLTEIRQSIDNFREELESKIEV